MDLAGQSDQSATVLLGIVSFLLTPQEPKRKIPATFPIAPPSRGDTGGPDRKEIARRFNGLDLLVLTKEGESAGIRVRVLLGDRRKRGGKSVQYLPGWTVQCINPECAARGHWLRAGMSGGEFCSNCSAPLHNVPPPLAPRLRMRPRSLGSYRPSGRPSGRPR